MVKKSKIQVVLSVLLLVVCIISLSACGSADNTASNGASSEDSAGKTSPANSQESETKTYQIGIAQTDVMTPFFGQMIKGFIDEAAKCSMKLDIRDGEDDPVKQMNQIETFIAQKKDLIIVVSSQVDALVPVAKKCNEAKIPIVAVNRIVGEGADIVTYVGCDDVEGGRLQGQLVEKMIGKGKKGNIILCQAPLGSAPQVLRQKGLEEYLKANAPDIKIAAEQAVDHDNDKTIAFVSNMLTRFPEGEIDGIVLHGPYEALAAAQAVQSAGRPELLGKIIGFDYPKVVRDAIKDKSLYGTINQEPYLEGVLGIQAAYKYLTGEQVEKSTYIDLPAVDPDNVDDIPEAWDDGK